MSFLQGRKIEPSLRALLVFVTSDEPHRLLATNSRARIGHSQVSSARWTQAGVETPAMRGVLAQHGLRSGRLSPVMSVGRGKDTDTCYPRSTWIARRRERARGGSGRRPRPRLHYVRLQATGALIASAPRCAYSRYAVRELIVTPATADALLTAAPADERCFAVVRAEHARRWPRGWPSW